MDDFRTRLMAEYSELRAKIIALKIFILEGQFETLPMIDQIDLRAQLRHMEAYSTVLNRRVSRLCNNT